MKIPINKARKITYTLKNMKAIKVIEKKGNLLVYNKI